MSNDRSMHDKVAELRALMALTRDSKSGATLVLDALLEATLKQQEGTPLGAVEVSEEGLIDFLALAGEQAKAEYRLAARSETDRPAEPVFQAFEEIVRDQKTLYDPEQEGFVGAAIHADLTREWTGSFCINVELKNIDGAQLAFVLDVARRYELQAREEEHYLTLRPHLIAVEEDEAERRGSTTERSL
jgi:hypothetical protein